MPGQRVDINKVRWNNFNADEQAKFKEVVYKSKGKANNSFGATLIALGVPVEEAVEYASNVDGYSYTFMPLHKNAKMKAGHRGVVQVFNAVPNFWDTIRGKQLVKKSGKLLAKLGLDPSEPLLVTRLDRELSKMYMSRSYKAGNVTYAAYREQQLMYYDVVAAKKIKTADVFAPLIDVEFKETGDGVEPLLSNTGDDNVHLPGYYENRKYDVESLANLGKDVLSKMRPWILMADVLRCNYDWNFRDESSSKSKQSIEIMCIIEAFYDMCREIGITGVMDNEVAGRCLSRATAKGIMQNVIKLGGTYRRLVNSGFAESVARETVVAEINENIAKRATRPQLRFYARTDYKDTPPEERKKSNSSNSCKGKGKGKRGKGLMSFDEFMKIAKKQS